MESSKKQRVAIVGSGMAGLVTAYLLQQDPRQRFSVDLFESGSCLSLDSASRTVRDPQTGVEDRVDLPMRAFAGGYYQNLIAMYNHLGVDYHPQRFIFQFSSVDDKDLADGGVSLTDPYFIHTSNNHRLPPYRPKGLHMMRHVVEIVYVLFWYTWFSACCMFFGPRWSIDGSRIGESFGEYVSRIGLPEYFLRFYLLPLMSSVATCPHSALLDFPASDLTNYKQKSNGQDHYLVSRGVAYVEQKLSNNLNIHLCSRVVDIEPLNPGIRLWCEQRNDVGESVIQCDTFEFVVLAVSPDVIQRIYKPLATQMSQIPTIQVESTLHTDLESRDRLKVEYEHKTKARHAAQVINLRTTISKHARTEAMHLQPSGSWVTTCPLKAIQSTRVIHTAKFPRVLRTTQSRAVVNGMFEEGSHTASSSQKLNYPRWRNGDGGVWVAGGWCWDGMVLLEGCIVSAMRVARNMDVDIPWSP